MLSSYFVAMGTAWIVAQGAKYIIVAVQQKRINHIRQLYLSGNMPSAHSATVAALVSLIALKDGTSTPLFALAALFLAIVMYDAVMVRRSSGEQGVAIQQLIKEQKSSVALPRAAKGHTPIEVIVGALLGTTIGWLSFWLQNNGNYS